MARYRRTHRLRGESVEAPWPPLTPEHGFPSLPPLHAQRPLARTQGAPPLSAPDRRSGRRSSSCTHFPSEMSLKTAKNSGPNGGRRQSPRMNSLRWHDPHQVKGSKQCFLSARRLPCFSRTLCHRRKKLSRGLRKGRKRGTIKPNKRGARRYGLRGDRKGPDP